MSIYSLIYLLLLIYMFRDFRKSFIIFSFLRILLNLNLNIVNLPGLPLLTIELACNLSYLFYYLFIIKRQRYQKFPLKGAYIVVAISIALSTVTSTAGLSSFTYSIGKFVNEYMFIYLLWRVLKTDKDVYLLVKGFIFLFLFLFIYGLIEKVTGYNPIYRYQLYLNEGAAQVTDFEYGTRLGLSRVRSAIIHPIGYGILSAGIINLYMLLVTRYKSFLSYNYLLSTIFIIFGLLNIFFTNSRSPILFFAIGFLGVINLKLKSTYKLLLVFLLGLLFSYNFIEPYLINILSIIQPSDYSDEVGGSSFNLRALQFSTAYFIVADNLFLGMGMESVQSYIGEKYPTLYGLESIWLWMLIERGVLGILTHIYLIYRIFKMGLNIRSAFICFFTIAWLITTSVTSTPGTGFPFFMTIVIIVYKLKMFRYGK